LFPWQEQKTILFSQKKALNPYEKKIWLMGRDGETNPNFQSWYSNVVVVFSLK
jgi:hypothetical protein